MSFFAFRPLFITLFVTGLIGSFGHCLGMCGPFVLLVGSRLPRRGGGSLPYYLLYHSGRIAVYGILGAIIGAVGSILVKSSYFSRASAVISLTLGLAIVFSGVLALGLMRLPISSRFTGWWRPAVNRVFQLPGNSGIFLLGVLNGLLPCGLVYSALLISASSANALTGSLGMVLFGLGTLPVLVAFGVGAGMAALSLRLALARVSGVFVILVGVQLMLRGAAALNIVSHLMMGKVMVW